MIGPCDALILVAGYAVVVMRGCRSLLYVVHRCDSTLLYVRVQMACLTGVACVHV